MNIRAKPQRTVLGSNPDTHVYLNPRSDQRSRASFNKAPFELIRFGHFSKCLQSFTQSFSSELALCKKLVFWNPLFFSSNFYSLKEICFCFIFFGPKKNLPSDKELKRILVGSIFKERLFCISTEKNGYFCFCNHTFG